MIDLSAPVPAWVFPIVFLVGFIYYFVCLINSGCTHTYHEQQLYEYNKYSIWQCQRRGHVPYYELRRKFRWWGEDVVTFDTDIAIIMKKLKQLEEFPSDVDVGALQYIRAELEKK